MTTPGFHALLSRLAHGWSTRDDASILENFTPDVRYADPLRYSFSDRANLQKFFEADQGLSQKTTLHTLLFDEARQLGAVEYTYEGTHRYHGVALIKLRDGLISHWREYQHIDQRPWQEFIAGTDFGE